MSSEETGSESEVEEDQATVERAERARKRELRREEKEAEAKKLVYTCNSYFNLLSDVFKKH